MRKIAPGVEVKLVEADGTGEAFQALARKFRPGMPI